LATFIHHTDPGSPELRALLESIPFCPGTCFFIDVQGSTAMKYSENLVEWGRKLHNTFNFISLLNDFPDNIVKGIGDEIMLYVPDDELRQKRSFNSYYQLLEEIYSTLFNLKFFPVNDMFLKCRVAIHYCREAYNITFFQNFNDYYGIDIDLTARLMTRCNGDTIVLSNAFYEKVVEDLTALDLPLGTGCLSGLSDMLFAEFKGVPGKVPYREIEL
jgi:class 3 adenylate cyclase